MFYAILPQAKFLASTTKMPSKVSHLKTHRAHERVEQWFFFFLLHIAVHCWLFISNKATMATGSICLPAWRPELPDSSRGLAGSFMKLTLLTNNRRHLERHKKLPAESGYMIWSELYHCILCYVLHISTNPSQGITYNAKQCMYMYYMLRIIT